MPEPHRFVWLSVTLSVACLLVPVVPLFAAEDSPGSAEGVVDNRPHAVFIVGTRHYSPHRTMPPLAEQMERLGWRTTVINPSQNPERNAQGIEGLEQLADADVAIIFVRWLRLPDDQLELLLDYVRGGGAVVGLRTTTHAFNYPENHPNHSWNHDFGHLVLGTPYFIHAAGTTQVEVMEGAADHPVLTGWPTEEVTASGTLYLSDLPDDATALLQGTGRPRRVGTVVNDYGTHELSEEETDVVAWTWVNQWGGRVYGSSLAHQRSFSNPLFVRLVVNGIYWAADLPVPGEEVQIDPIELQ